MRCCDGGLLEIYGSSPSHINNAYTAYEPVYLLIRFSVVDVQHLPARRSALEMIENAQVKQDSREIGTAKRVEIDPIFEHVHHLHAIQLI